MTGRLPVVLPCLFLAVALARRIDPYDRSDWLLENALMMLMPAVVLAGHQRRPLPNLAYVDLFVFLLLHEVGLHHTFRRCPARSGGRR